MEDGARTLLAILVSNKCCIKMQTHSDIRIGYVLKIVRKTSYLQVAHRLYITVQTSHTSK